MPLIELVEPAGHRRACVVRAVDLTDEQAGWTHRLHRSRRVAQSRVRLWARRAPRRARLW
jgi:hypothetical protein